MAKIKLTKSAVDAAQPQAQAVELRDTPAPGLLCKITPAGRKVFMLQRTNAGDRRKPALGLYGELNRARQVCRIRFQHPSNNRPSPPLIGRRRHKRAGSLHGYISETTGNHLAIVQPSASVIQGWALYY